jgi:hypothetical protein
MTPETHDLLMRVAEAVQSASFNAALGDYEGNKMRGHHASADGQRSAAHAVKQLNVAAIVATVAEISPEVPEVEAFKRAAAANHLNTLVGQDGSFKNPMTVKAQAIWGAAVRWAHNQAGRPP